MITILLLLLLLLRQLSGRKRCLAPAAFIVPHPTLNPYHSFQTEMPIFRVLLSAVMAVGSLASFNPFFFFYLHRADWLRRGGGMRGEHASRSLRVTPDKGHKMMIITMCGYFGDGVVGMNEPPFLPFHFV